MGIGNCGPVSYDCDEVDCCEDRNRLADELRECGAPVLPGWQQAVCATPARLLRFIERTENGYGVNVDRGSDWLDLDDAEAYALDVLATVSKARELMTNEHMEGLCGAPEDTEAT